MSGEGSLGPQGSMVPTETTLGRGRRFRPALRSLEMGQQWFSSMWMTITSIFHYKTLRMVGICYFNNQIDHSIEANS